MAAPRPPDPPSFQPVVSAVARRQALLGVLLALLGAISVLVGLWAMGVVLVAGGAVVGAIAMYARRTGAAAQLVNRAYDTIARGKLGEAEALLDRAALVTRAGYLRRVIDVQRAIIALRRGELGPALARVDTALAKPVGIVARGQSRLQIAGAHGIRALLRAAQGDGRGAEQDAAFVRASRDAGPEELARAELATAIVMERGGDREALRRHLTEKRTLLLEYTAPRERAVVRAYQRMLEARRASVYREGAPREPERAASEEPTVADWMAAVVPAAAPFARAGRAVPGAAGAQGAAAEAPEVIDLEAKRAAKARIAAKGGARKVGLVLALWAALVGVFLVIWGVFDRLDGDFGETGFGVSLGLMFLVVWVAAVLAVVALRVHGHGQAQRLFGALRAIASDDEARGEAELRALSKSRYPLVAGRAWKELAVRSERRGDFAAALAACDQAVRSMSKTAGARAVATYFLLPEVIAERAFVLAVSDRDAEAGAEMAMLQETYPSHPFRARAELRVGLVRRARRGDLAGAAALCAQGTEDVPLALRDEALADVVRAAVHPEAAGAGEIERLKRELRLDPGLRGWLEKVAPAATAAFAAAEHHRAGAEVEAARDTADAATAEPASDADDEALAEHEAAALEEAAAAHAATAGRRADPISR